MISATILTRRAEQLRGLGAVSAAVVGRISNGTGDCFSGPSADLTMCMSDCSRITAGVDVGGVSKGFHAVALKNGTCHEKRTYDPQCPMSFETFPQAVACATSALVQCFTVVSVGE